MSRLEELSNSLKARAEQIAGRIQDSEAYQKLAERYQGLTPRGQRIATLVIIATIAFVVLFSPMTSYFSSKEQTIIILLLLILVIFFIKFKELLTY